ncbi:MAG: DEAD/DEAH box helicase family protein [Synergistaceae bacterium]|nr:DEAD/DEAH box helicase family protein [Synergistaceae bacterium]MBQ6739827.1 DEAD/DEAH box helicase family protein [Synergistaceae bacterium]MBQ6909420.1 DEAD/DEAH box helicase family protein [Synergistaceae bacterium]MBR0043614.1 DEAD/DEAH box helicase family protein [Synergistaceae bacterium]MBR0096104.1 DEAD/DEAH box helicase family protein [Synergistaceae bacterium]
MITPRAYQFEVLKSIISSWRDDGITRQLISLPTVYGKTIIFCLVAEALRLPTLIIVHREELLYQAEQKLKLIYPEADIGICVTCSATSHALDEKAA